MAIPKKILKFTIMLLTRVGIAQILSVLLDQIENKYSLKLVHIFSYRKPVPKQLFNWPHSAAVFELEFCGDQGFDSLVNGIYGVILGVS